METKELIRRARKKAYRKGEGIDKENPGKRKLIAEADAWLSRYVRLFAYNDRGLVECYTCNKLFYIKNIQCGHFIGRGHYSTRFDIRNVRPQCKLCNGMRGGEPGAYARRLIKEIGMDEFLNLLEIGADHAILKTEDLQELIATYKEQTEKLLKVHHLQPWW